MVLRSQREREYNPSKIRSKIKYFLKNCGAAYVSCRPTGRMVEARKVTRFKCKCHLNCLKNVSEADQSLIFSEYWDIGDIGQ